MLFTIHFLTVTMQKRHRGQIDQFLPIIYLNHFSSNKAQNVFSIHLSPFINLSLNDICSIFILFMIISSHKQDKRKCETRKRALLIAHSHMCNSCDLSTKTRYVLKPGPSSVFKVGIRKVMALFDRCLVLLTFGFSS